MKDPGSDKEYYYHTETGETSWDRPVELSEEEGAGGSVISLNIVPSEQPRVATLHISSR